MVNLVSFWLLIGTVSLIILMILLLLLKPMYEKYIKIDHIKTNVNALINEIGWVTTIINNQKSTGLVKINGQIWSAKSLGNEIILPGKKVRVVKIEGVKLIVEMI